MNSKKRKTKKKEPTKSKNSKGNANDGVTKHTQLPGSARDGIVDVEIKDKLLVHPVGRWFEEVNKRLWIPHHLVDTFQIVLRGVFYIFLVYLCVVFFISFLYTYVYIQRFYIL